MRKLLLLVLFGATIGACAPPAYYVANVYDNNGTLTEDRCSISAFTGKPDPSDCHSEAVGDSPDSGSRYSEVEEVPVIPPVVLKPVAVDRAKYRNAAIELARRADVAARANDCATAKTDADQVNIVDRDYYATVVLKDPTLATCLAPATT